MHHLPLWFLKDSPLSFLCVRDSLSSDHLTCMSASHWNLRLRFCYWSQDHWWHHFLSVYSLIFCWSSLGLRNLVLISAIYPSMIFCNISATVSHFISSSSIVCHFFYYDTNFLKVWSSKYLPSFAFKDSVLCSIHPLCHSFRSLQIPLTEFGKGLFVVKLCNENNEYDSAALRYTTLQDYCITLSWPSMAL